MMHDDNVRFEVCVDSGYGLNAAIEGGADRLELCSALALGGLSPGPGLIELAARSDIPCHAMIRTRSGDFVCSSVDLELMVLDIAAVRQAGLAGAVFGVLRPDNTLDVSALETLVAASDSMDTTLHRAFDITADPFQAIEVAIELGFTRILTSGQANAAPDGAGLISQLVEQAAGRIQIMAGGGVTLESIPRLLATGVDAIHASCSSRLMAHRDCSLINIEQRVETDKVCVSQFKDSIGIAR